MDVGTNFIQPSNVTWSNFYNVLFSESNTKHNLCSGKATIISATQATFWAWDYTSCVVLFIWNAGKKEQANVINLTISKI